MTDDIQTAFRGIRAEEALKSNTLLFLQTEISKQNSARSRFAYRKLVAALASVAIVFLSGVLSHELYFTPSAYVDLDVNPSIELTLNRFNRVITTSSYNDDGAVILQSVNARHKSYDQAVQVLLEAMISQDYLKQDGLVSMTVQSNDKDMETKLLDVLQSVVSLSLDSHRYTAKTEFFSVSQEVKQHAHDNDLSPAKYLAIVQLQKVDPDATFECCAGHSLSEIHELTRRRNCRRQGGGHHNGGHH